MFMYCMYVAMCNLNYYLNLHYFLLDIMECKDGLHNCSQICIELQGEYSCACYSGYELQEDGASCKGTYSR